MTRLIPLALAAALAAAPVAAQEAEEPSLLEEGADLLFRGLIEEVAPPLQELAGIGSELLPIFETLAREMGPAIAEVAGQIDSITYYEPPVIAPNGDIVLRRRADAPDWTPPEPEADPDPDAEPTPAPEAAPTPDADPAPDLDVQSNGEIEL